jgi:hypothetical protein
MRGSAIETSSESVIRTPNGAWYTVFSMNARNLQGVAVFVDMLPIFDLQRNTVLADRDHKIYLQFRPTLGKPGEVQPWDGARK